MKKIILAIILVLVSIELQSQTWNHQIQLSSPLYSAYAYNANTAWVSGANGSVYYTSNGGLNWVPRGTTMFAGNSVFSIQALSSTTAICVCNVAGVGRVFRTIDAGQTWTNPFFRTNVILNDVKFVNSNTGYVFGNPVGLSWFVIRTINGGITWDTLTVTRPPAINVNETGYPNCSYVMQVGVGGPIRIWFGSNLSWIHSSINGGITWDTAFINPFIQIRAVTFRDSTYGFLSGQLVFRSTNAGNNWSQHSVPIVGPCISITNSGGFFWYTSGPSIYYSSNNGTSFVFQYTNPSSSLYNHMSMVYQISDMPTTINGWAVTDNGTITHYSETIGIQQNGTQIPKAYNLKQNYPNPFNPKTNIQFDIPANGYVELTVYDILGNAVESVFKGELKAGSYKADFDASNLSSGIYFYKLLSHDFSQTRKMIVVK